jgi:hypothetical protein
MNEEKYLALVQEMVLRFPKQEVSDASQVAYAVDLADLPYDELRYVCQQLWRTEEWFPSIATIRKAWADLVMGPAAAGQAQQWAEAQIGRIGGYSPSGGFIEPKYPDPILRETMKIFGWQRLARADSSSDWLDKDFAKAYEQGRDIVARQVMSGELKAPPAALPEHSDRPALRLVAG